MRAFLWYTNSNSRVNSKILFSQVRQTCEQTLDFNTALRKAGLGHYISSRPYGTRFQSSSRQRYAPVTLNAPRTAVWSEYAGHSSQRRNTWSPAYFKALHEYVGRVNILKALPGRNWVSIVQQANTLEFSRPKMDTEKMPDRVSWADYELLERLRWYTAEGAPKKGGYVWQIEGDIGINYW
jgi:hypothetical protein